MDKMQPEDDLPAERLWQHRGKARPVFAIEPGKGQESVWDYPRPPVLVEDSRPVEMRIDERARPQTGGFYGGWVTNEVVGPFKGEPGTGGW